MNIEWERAPIQGVEVIDLAPIHDDRGFLMEILRSDWDVYKDFGQAYITTTYEDAVKGWHMHKEQTDLICCIGGMIKLVVADHEYIRDHGTYDIHYLGERSPKLIKIPPRVWHGWTAYNGMATILNIPDKLYDYKEPDENRLDPWESHLPVLWEREDK